MNNTNETGWNFDNSYARLPKKFFSTLHPTPVSSPKLIIFNQTLADELGLDVDRLQSKQGVEELAGNKIPDGANPLAQAYAGHQFAHFTMLGDGRAILLGEQKTPQGERFDIQLKGPGRTPYSRGGDGRAALGPMLREYIMSEAMHALGIPTTRSLAVVTTGETVYRETELPGAILTRVASSHIRVGTFQYAAQWGTTDDLKSIADYTLERHFPHLKEMEDKYILLFREVMKLQAHLIARWQLVGFIHGVMNTDNMALCGETIDYGPCAFMDTYNLATVFSSIDRQGRYAYGNQPAIAGWNLARFAETLLPLLDEDQEKAVQLAQDELAHFEKMFLHHWYVGMRSKLGLFHEQEEDEDLIKDLLGMMQKYEADYTNTFRALTLDHPQNTNLINTDEFADWYVKWKKRRNNQKESVDASRQLMISSNPYVIPRNHRVEEALEAANEGDFSVLERLLQVLSKPYESNSELEEYTHPPEPSERPYRTYCGT